MKYSKYDEKKNLEKKQGAQKMYGFGLQYRCLGFTINMVCFFML